MFDQILGYVVMLGILSVLIIVHECGHFSVARFFGFQTPVFGFGLPFGPHWVVGKKWGTEFRIHAALLGGYVAIPELGDESNAEAFSGMNMTPFRKFPIWQRALVAFAGVGFNILFAYLIMFFMYLCMGEPTQTSVVGSLPPNGPTIAAQAGVKVGDEIHAIDSTPINTTTDIINYLGEHKGTPVQLHLVRNESPITINVTPNENGKVGMGLDGKGPIVYKKLNNNVFDIGVMAGVKLWDMTRGMLSALGDMVSGIASGGKKAAPGHATVGMSDLHGVLAVVKIGADILKQDWSQLFLFTVLISMDLAIINLFPWPALDGGHLAFMAFEAIRGRPMGERAQGEIVKWGFITLLALMAVIMVNDVTALVTGKLDFKKDKQNKDKDKGADSKGAPDATKSDAQSDAKDGTAKTGAPASSSDEPAKTDSAIKDGTAKPDAVDSKSDATPTPAK